MLCAVACVCMEKQTHTQNILAVFLYCGVSTVCGNIWYICYKVNYFLCLNI